MPNSPTPLHISVRGQGLTSMWLITQQSLLHLPLLAAAASNVTAAAGSRAAAAAAGSLRDDRVASAVVA